MDSIRTTIEHELEKAQQAVKGWEGVLEALGRVSNGAVKPVEAEPVEAKPVEAEPVGPSAAILAVLSKGQKMRFSELTEAVLQLPNFTTHARDVRATLSAVAFWMTKRGQLRMRKVQGRNVYSRV